MSITSEAISGINNNLARLNVTANNIANSNTEGYRAKEVSITNDDKISISEAGATLSQNYEPSNENTTVEAAPSNVDLGKELLDLQVTKFNIQANIKALKVADEVTQSILDLLA
jgi:flagellar basal-body rod protein FlgC